MKTFKHCLNIIYSEDQRNLLPDNFEDFIKDNYGTFEDFLSDTGYDAVNDFTFHYLDRAKEELEDEYDDPTDDEIEDRASEIAIEVAKEERESIFYSCLELYKKLGFDFVGKTQPNYYYIIDGLRHHRFNFRKDKLVKEGYDINKTEHEIMLERKIYRIYNSGNLKFIYKGKN